MLSRFIALSMCAFLMFSAFFTHALSIGERVTLNSKVLNETRELQVLLPESYLEYKHATYPVVYLLDGDYNFHSVSGLVDSLANKGEVIPEVILVGLADKGTQTYRQYMTPKTLSGNDTFNAEQFLAFITNEVQPYIRKQFRTADHTTLIGQSMGGLFVLNALLDQPQAFSEFVAISPSVWVGDNAIVKKAKTTFSKNPEFAGSLHVSLADEKQMGIYSLLNLLDNQAPNALTWQFKHYPTESHNSIGSIALRDAFKSMFKGWYIPEGDLVKQPLADLLTPFVQVRTKLGIKQPMSAGSVHTILRQYYRQKQADKIPAFINQAILALPTSKQVLITKQAAFAGHYQSPEHALTILKTHESELNHSIGYLKSLASTYEQLNNPASAQHYYQQALSQAKTQGANQWQLNILNAKVK